MSAAEIAAVEEPFFFPLGGDRIFGFLHATDGQARASIVMCHALAEEKLWSHRIYVTFAREMARLGYATLRFDARGEGDSSLEFESSTIESRIQDTLRAIEVMRERLPNVGPLVLLGHRLGASIAAAAAERAGSSVSGLVLWDPIVDGEDYLGQLLRSNLATQMATQGKVTRTREVLTRAILEGETVIVDGYGLTPELCRQLTALRLAQSAEALAHPTLLLEVPKGGQTEPTSQLAALCASRPRLRVQLAQEPPFWRETRQFHKRAASFTKATLDWLQDFGS